MTEWAHAAVSNLRSLRPPLVGVTGPRVKGGNAAILTHDFVHRTHLDVFPTYYPPALCDWWLDDWISATYGPERTVRGPVPGWTGLGGSTDCGRSASHRRSIPTQECNSGISGPFHLYLMFHLCTRCLCTRGAYITP